MKIFATFVLSSTLAMKSHAQSPSIASLDATIPSVTLTGSATWTPSSQQTTSETPPIESSSSASGTPSIGSGSPSPSTTLVTPGPSGTGSPRTASNDFMSSLSPTAYARDTTDEYRMKPVHAVLSRVQSDMPAWNRELRRFASRYYDDAHEAYTGLMDTVNSASCEGVLMYAQAEGINYNTRSEEERCTRKNDMAYIVFYEVAVVQTNETLALYQETASQNEYGPMLPMDSGRVTPDSTSSSGEEVFPLPSLYINGDNGQPEIGPYVGASLKATDPRAPYPHNVWYSFPNSCPFSSWSDKTPECRANTRKGLCDLGVMPDGFTCTYNYRVLGFLALDDLVGITSMVSSTTGETYANFSQFCEDGGVEFMASESGEVEQSISFWENPQDETANTERFAKLIQAYQNLTSGMISGTSLSSETIARMLPLPSPEALASENPACYLNVQKCNTPNGCRRSLYGSTCQVCDTMSEGCEAPPEGFIFPTLELAVGEDGGTGNATNDGTMARNSDAPADGVLRSGVAMNEVSVVLMSLLLALMTVFFF